MKRKLSTVVIWLVTALFAFSFALPAWAAWIRLFVIHNGNPFAPAVSRFAVYETVDPVLEQASILSSLWTTPTLFFLLLLCLAVRRESPRTMLFTIYFSLAAGFALLFLPLCFPAAHHPVTYISLENLLFIGQGAAKDSNAFFCWGLFGCSWPIGCPAFVPADQTPYPCVVLAPSCLLRSLGCLPLLLPCLCPFPLG